jgi:hypothetical protein
MISRVGEYLSKIWILGIRWIWVGIRMAYAIEIELPRSGVWFKYFSGVDSLEEAEGIKQAAEGNINARIMKN